MKEILEKYKDDGLVYSQAHPTLPLTIYNYTDKCTWENAWDEITLQARGIVVDDLGNVVSRPFNKFFNLSEGKTNVTDDYVIYEKLDGSFIQLFYYEGVWVVSSRGSFTSEQAVWAQEMLENYNLDLLSTEFTYCFELIKKENRIVVKYNFEGLILTGAFHICSGIEIEIDLIPIFEKVERYSSDASLLELHTLIKDDEEGFVIRFSNGERCKIKGAEYLRLHKAMSEMSTTAVWECLKNGTSVTEKLQDFPDEWFHLIREYEQELIQNSIDLFIDVDRTYRIMTQGLPNNIDGGSFARLIKGHKYEHYFFSLRNGKDITERIWKNLKPTYKKL